MFKFLSITLTILLSTSTIDSQANGLYRPGVLKEPFNLGGNTHNRVFNTGNGLRPAGNVRPNVPGRNTVASPGNNAHVATAKVNLSGKYYIKECYDGRRVVSTPRWFKFTLEITAQAVGPHHTYIGYRLIYTVGNKVWAHMTKIKDGRWVISNEGQTYEFKNSADNTDEARAEKFVLNFDKWFSHFKVNADVVTFYGKNGSRMVLVRAKAEKQH